MPDIAPNKKGIITLKKEEVKLTMIKIRVRPLSLHSHPRLRGLHGALLPVQMTCLWNIIMQCAKGTEQNIRRIHATRHQTQPIRKRNHTYDDKKSCSSAEEPSRNDGGVNLPPPPKGMAICT